MRHFVRVLRVIDHHIKRVCRLCRQWIREALDCEWERLDSAHSSRKKLSKVDDPVKLDISHTVEFFKIDKIICSCYISLVLDRDLWRQSDLDIRCWIKSVRWSHSERVRDTHGIYGRNVRCHRYRLETPCSWRVSYPCIGILNFKAIWVIQLERKRACRTSLSWVINWAHLYVDIGIGWDILSVELFDAQCPRWFAPIESHSGIQGPSPKSWHWCDRWCSTGICNAKLAWYGEFNGWICLKRSDCLNFERQARELVYLIVIRVYIITWEHFHVCALGDGWTSNL